MQLLHAHINRTRLIAGEVGVFLKEISQLSEIHPLHSLRGQLSSLLVNIFSRDYGKTFEGENFRVRKLSRILQFSGYLWKFSLQNLGVGHLWCCKSEQSAKFFSLESFLLYGTLSKNLCVLTKVLSSNRTVLSSGV